MEIKNLRTNYIENPIGYLYENLHLTWTIRNTKEAELTAKKDTWTRIVVSDTLDFSNVLVDTGEMLSYGKPYYDLQLTLKAHTCYFWYVSICAGKSVITSETAFFETGKLEEAWMADFITAGEESDAMPFLYKEIGIEKPVAKANLYCLGLGVYELYLDEEKQGEEFLLPGYHSYDLMQQYQTFDLTERLSEGQHTLGFLLGNGWYKGRFVFEGGYTNLYGDKKKLIAELHITYKDGSSEIIVSDESWKAVASDIFENDIYDGERIRVSDTHKPLQVEAAEGDKTLLCERLNPPIHAVERIKVKEILHTPKGETVLDFGESVTGWVEVTLWGSEKKQILLSYGELLQEGNFFRDNLRTAKAEFSIGGKVSGVIRPHFTFYGFRYVKVEGMEQVHADDFTAVRLMSDLEQTGEITTENDKINTLIENTRRSQKCNFLDIPTDCPQRDERMGWTGDIAIFANAASYHMNTASFLRHYMKNLMLEQKQLKGSVPFFVPRPKPEYHEGMNAFLYTDGVCVWGDAATILPWTLFEHYQDIEMLRLQYPSMRDWVNHVTERTRENANAYLWQNDRQLGDWLALDNGDINNPIGKTDGGMIATAYYYHSIQLCEKAARQLELIEEAKKWKELAGLVRGAFLKEYTDESGDLKGAQTQTGYALLLYFGLYEESRKQVLISGLKRMLLLYNNHLSTGFVGTALLCRVLSENGMNDLAYTLLLNEDYPSWLLEVKLGATTVWERWNSVGEDGKISPLGMNSLNHYAYGCIVEWMYEYMCGFRYTDKGEFIISPMPDARLGAVKGSYETIWGLCRSEWEYKADGNVSYRFEIPFGAQIPVRLVDGREFLLESGSYSIPGI